MMYHSCGPNLLALNIFSLLPSGCFWVGINHTGKGLWPLGKKNRDVLQIVSLAVQIVFWIYAIIAIVIVAKDNLENLDILTEELEKLEEDLDMDRYTYNPSPNISKPSINQMEYYEYYGDKRSNITSEMESRINSVVVFCGGNTLYTLMSMFIALVSMVSQISKTRDDQGPREHAQIELCFDICQPCDSFRIFHHILHRSAFVLNFMSIFIGTHLMFSVPCTAICLIQCIISYLYAEDIVLCGVPFCCFQFWFIRRYPSNMWATVIPLNQRFSKRTETKKMTKEEVISDETLFKPPTYLSTFSNWTDPPPYSFNSQTNNNSST